jgi:hypothetical protein
MDDASSETRSPQQLSVSIIERPIRHSCRSDGTLPDDYFGDQQIIPTNMPLAHLVNTYWQHGYTIRL